MSLSDVYNAAVVRGDIQDNPQQRQILTALQRITDELLTVKSWFRWRKLPPTQGLYLYGPVGVGKTYLMDLFYEHLAEHRKARFHFHYFMQQIDAQLRRLQGHKDPLRCIAADFAKTTRVLCFDEFLVEDVAYAMILAELLQALFNHGVILVATSNTKPDNLYLKGVHRERFLPAIVLIKAHCEVIKLSEKIDYRLGRIPMLTTYLYPLNLLTSQRLYEQFMLLCPQLEEGKTLIVQNREISVIKLGRRIVWFDFNVICNLPRSQLDYIEIAERFDTVFISDIPALTPASTVHAILLIHLIDVLYDRGIRLISSAAVPLVELYHAGEMVKPFKRTLSRLQEMQSEDYLTRHPRRAISVLGNPTA